MITPVMQSLGQAALDAMQSMLDEIDQTKQQEEEKRTGQTTDPLLKAKMHAADESRRSQGKISGALFSMARVDVNELKNQLYDKFGKELGVERKEGMAGFAYGRAIETALYQLTSTVDLEKSLNLRGLGVSFNTIIAAIKNPYSDASVALGEAIEKLYGDGKTTAAERGKVLQRLSDVADPKSLAELTLVDKPYDPDRVEDEETRAERAEDIEAKEAEAKLEKLQDLQAALKKPGKSPDDGKDGGRDDGGSAAGRNDRLAILAAMAEGASAPSSSGADQDGDAGQDRGKPAGPQDGASLLEEARSQAEGAAQEALAKGDSAEGQTPGDRALAGEGARLHVESDDAGIYALLAAHERRKRADLA
ncbi:hypothetical protein [Rhizobium sp. SSA_523]|uniref:hypothetical protein n=1 Tax=Rhizobium sp. SSA_523 TaxID=2952477 RepID=UPI0020901991|nr:hypothetical protein [Rhizobium sp. SSA_523]MCO5732886.1 hypothetical protein [Rhizobium sp. SSA_523]WKC23497.1 hypothetical protein QTJ18_22315 [Rhizobium sp. SSA_523]